MPFEGEDCFDHRVAQRRPHRDEAPRISTPNVEIIQGTKCLPQVLLPVLRDFVAKKPFASTNTELSTGFSHYD
jgi:hypothetical protein